MISSVDASAFHTPVTSTSSALAHLPVTFASPAAAGPTTSTDGSAGIDQLLVQPTALALGSTTTNLPSDTTEPITLNDSVAVSVTPGVRVPATHDIGLVSVPAVIASVVTFVGPSISPPFKSFVLTSTFAAPVTLDGFITRVTLNTII